MSLLHDTAAPPSSSPSPSQNVMPGKARVIKCLMENMAQPNFGEECRVELQKREQVVKNDYRCEQWLGGVEGVLVVVWEGDFLLEGVLFV